MKPPARIYGLTDFRLSPSQLRRLGRRPISISIQQRGPALSRLIPLTPRQRENRTGQKLQAGLRRLQRRWPDAGITARGNGRLPWTLDAVLPAYMVTRVAAEPNVSDIWVKRVPGRRRKPTKRKLRFYCVWGSVAIQVEDVTRGRVDVEDELVLVKAYSVEDAQKRLTKYWRDYGAPYLNSQGELVRWQLVEVLDVYEVGSDELDPKGAEVYSRIRQKRMKAAYIWRPRAKGA